MNSEKRKEKARRLLKISGEPTINPLNYRSSIAEALNYYNVIDNKDKKLWVLDYLQVEGIKIPKAPSVHEREFKTLGALVRLKLNENFLEESEEQLILTEIDRIKELSEKPTRVVEEDKPTREIDRNEEKAKQVLAEIDGLIDEYQMTRTVPNIGALFVTMGVTGQAGKKIADRLVKKVEQVREALESTDPQVKEGWSNFTRPELKKLLQIYETAIEKAGQSKRIVQRQPKQRKEKPAAVVASKVKYQIKDEELGLRSVPPANIIGSTELYVYSTKYRKLSCFKALQGMQLSVNGTTIVNFDEKASFQKIIRKPENLKSLNEQGKRFYQNFMKEINAAEGGVTGRMNDEMIILAAFK